MSQTNYIRGMVSEWSRDVGAPLPLNLMVSRPENDPVLEGPDVKRFRSSLGELSWVAGQSRPDIAFSANFLSRFMATPTRWAFAVVERAQKYLILTP